MLSESSFSDRSIADQFHASLIDRFYDAFEPPIRTLLNECTFGFVPDRSGVRTLFLVATNLEVATQLKESIDTILDRVADLMPGIEKTAICFLPSDREAAPHRDANGGAPPSKFMMGQVFPVPQQAQGQGE